MPRIYGTRATAFALMVIVGLAARDSLRAQKNGTKPQISPATLTGEQLGVYRALLVGWFQTEAVALNLAERTSLSDSLNSSSEIDCMKGLAFEPQVNEVHLFQQQDLSQLGLGSGSRLVDPDSYAEQAHRHDPGNEIRKGKPVDEAVSDGFAHGLFTLGEIRFDHDHSHAVVSFSFWCGSLCGHGSTMLLEKKNGIWKPKKQCGGWVS